TYSANPGDIAKLLVTGSAAYTVTAASNLSVGALLLQNLSGNQAITLAVSNALTVSSGLLLTMGTGSGADNIVGGTTNLGGEGIVFNNNAGTGNTLINSVIAGSNGLTLGGTGGTLVLPNANTYTGATNSNGGPCRWAPPAPSDRLPMPWCSP